MRQKVFGPRNLIQFRALDVDVLLRIPHRIDAEGFAVLQFQGYFLEKWAAHRVLPSRRTHRIKTQRRKHVPG